MHHRLKSSKYSLNISAYLNPDVFALDNSGLILSFWRNTKNKNLPIQLCATPLPLEKKIERAFAY
jgi:hypothetical protein